METKLMRSLLVLGITLCVFGCATKQDSYKPQSFKGIRITKLQRPKANNILWLKMIGDNNEPMALNLSNQIVGFHHLPHSFRYSTCTESASKNQLRLVGFPTITESVTNFFPQSIRLLTFDTKTQGSIERVIGLPNKKDSTLVEMNCIGDIAHFTSVRNEDMNIYFPPIENPKYEKPFDTQHTFVNWKTNRVLADFGIEFFASNGPPNLSPKGDYFLYQAYNNPNKNQFRVNQFRVIVKQLATGKTKEFFQVNEMYVPKYIWKSEHIFASISQEGENLKVKEYDLSNFETTASFKVSEYAINMKGFNASSFKYIDGILHFIGDETNSEKHILFRVEDHTCQKLFEILQPKPEPIEFL